MKRLTYLFIGALLVLTQACEKVTLDCDYTVTPAAQLDAKDEKGPILENAGGYAFMADTTQWKVASYADAKAGILTNRKSGEKMNSTIQATRDSQLKLHMNLTTKSAIIVIYDLERPMYAWRQVVITENLPQVTVPLIFRLWEQRREYIDLKWNIVNDSPAQPK